MSTSPILTRVFHHLPTTIQNAIRKEVRRSNLLLLLKFYFGTDNILREKGWLCSERRGVPVDGEGIPTPWYTYSMIDFLEERIGEGHRVFEYGSGYSTLWYAEKAGDVVAVEDSNEWADIITNKVADNGTVIHQTSMKNYTLEVTEHEKFHVIVIDGSHRTECIEPSLKSLSNEGVIIWDDFNWVDETEYQPILNEGFSVLPFRGLKALGANYKSTAVFYRSDNCLGI